MLVILGFVYKVKSFIMDGELLFYESFEEGLMKVKGFCCFVYF